MKRLLPLFVLLFSAPTMAAIAYDATSNPTDGTGNFSWTHTPAGTPKGVLVFIVEIQNGTDRVSSVSYGGVACTEVSGSPYTKATGEPGVVHCFFLGAEIPTGAQTVSVTVSGAGTKAAQCITVTAGTSQTLVNSTNATINGDAVANPSATQSLSSISSFVCEGFHSGQGSTANITELSGWTNRRETSGISTCAGFYTYNTVSTADVSIGWTQTSDDAVCIGVALKEYEPPTDQTVKAARKKKIISYNMKGGITRCAAR